MNKNQTAYELKIRELHNEVENKAKELQSKIDVLENIKREINFGHLKRESLIKSVKEREQELELLNKAIKEKENKLEEKPEEEIVNKISENIEFLKTSINSLNFEEFQARMEENMKLMEKNEELEKNKENLEKSIINLKTDLDNSFKQLEKVKSEKTKIYGELDKAKEEYAFMGRQVEGWNAKLAKIKFYAERLARAKGRNVVPELDDLAPFKVFPNKREKIK